jgi:SAM-dependent methyltransferase
MTRPDKRAVARSLAQKAWAENRPLEWFEELYQQAKQNGASIPWGDLVPNPNLVALYAKCQNIPLGRRALKIGCGLGDDAEWMADQGFDTTAFDIAPTAIERCRERFPHSTVHYFEADLFSSPDEWNGSFDWALESYTLQVLPPAMRHEAIQRISAYVRPGGYLLLIARGRSEDDPEGTMPWPLLRSELNAFADYGLRPVIFEDVLDQQESPTRRFRICYRKT